MHDIDLLNISEYRKFPLSICWAAPDNPAKLHVFHCYSDWDKFITGLSLNKQVPQAISTKYDRAQALYLMAWIRDDVIKAGELAALVALELALKIRYQYDFQENIKSSFLLSGLRFMVESDGLTDDKLPIHNKSKGVVIANLFEIKREKRDKDNFVKRNDTLVSFRNSLAHGDPFDGLAIGSLLEIVRDLIEYMYRDH